MNCGKESLVKDVVKALTGLSKSELSPKENHLCLYCETLMIITTEPKKALSIQSNAGNIVTLRSSKK